MIKLISSDMDGTLLDSYRQINPDQCRSDQKSSGKWYQFYYQHRT